MCISERNALALQAAMSLDLADRLPPLLREGGGRLLRLLGAILPGERGEEGQEEDGAKAKRRKVKKRVRESESVWPEKMGFQKNGKSCFVFSNVFACSKSTLILPRYDSVSFALTME